MSFVWPQALLLAVPLLVLVFRFARVPGPAFVLRVVLVLALVVALARPEFSLRSAGSDVVVVVDRSDSMPPRADATADELIRLVQAQRRPGDRVGVISFGRVPRVDQPLSAEAQFQGFTSTVDAEASNLEAALQTAADLIPAERVGRVLVVSDGRATGLDARAAARRLAARGIAVDWRFVGREDAALDVAVSNLEVPLTAVAKEPFQLAATLKASAPTKATVTLFRNGSPLVKTERTLVAGANLLTFRDLVEKPGLAAWELKVEAAGDSVDQNNVGRAVGRIEGPPRVLLITDSPSGTLAQTLSAAHLDVEVRTPFPLEMKHLENVGAVVLENVEAGRLSESGLQVLAQFVKEAGGGLVMTGGKNSFGEGGYRKSPVEDVLPVSLEIREEQRKAAVAMSIIMDCSCSMGVRVPDGRTKMELAAVGALQLLNKNDEASVHMVDTGDHEIFPMSSVGAGLPLGQVSRGFSGGGGIYVDVGLHTARDEILRSSKPTRHVLLFSDAADSEQPGDYQRTINELVGQGVTVSVIGMGSPTDSDADLLRDVAKRGNGRMYFAEDVTSLPRIFSQETIAVARSSFIDVPTSVRVTADLTQLGRFAQASGTGVDGYNLTYVRPQASVAMRTEDDNAAPLLAFWPRGAGRVVALTAEVDGKYTGALKTWPTERAVIEQAVRWVMPAQARELEGVARALRVGNDLHVTLDLDAHGAPPTGNATLVLLSGDARVAPIELPMRWEDEDRLGAHFVMPGSGTWHPVVKLGDRVFRAPPATLPWAPEFEPAPAKEGREWLSAVSKAGNGVERLSMTGLFADALQSEARVALAPFLVAVALLLMLSEVLLRRFFATEKIRRRVKLARTMVKAASAPRVGVTEPTPVAAAEPQPANQATLEEKPAVKSALEQARERARRRTER